MARSFTQSASGQLLCGTNGLSNLMVGASKVIVSSWIYPLTPGSSDNCWFCAYEDFTTLNDGYLLGFLGTGTACIFCRSQPSDSTHTQVNGVATVPLNQWVHSLFVVDFGGKTITSYLNGAVDINAVACPNFSTSTGYQIGSGGSPPQDAIGNENDGSGADSFNGAVAEVAIWTLGSGDPTFTANEAKALANGRNPLRFRRNKLGLYMPLYGDVSPEYDLSGNKVVGTITTAPKFTSHPPVDLISQSF